MIFFKLRIAGKCLVASRAYRPLSLPHYRNASTSRHTIQPTGNPVPSNEEEFLEKLKDTPLYNQILQNPEAVKAVAEFGVLLKNAGLEVPLTKKPSMMQLMKFVSNQQLREGALRVAEELKKAGIDISTADSITDLVSTSKTEPYDPERGKK